MSNQAALPGLVYQVAFLHSPVAKVIFNVSGEILEANLAAEAMFLYSCVWGDFGSQPGCRSHVPLF
jgi:hypothetical protein